MVANTKAFSEQNLFPQTPTVQQRPFATHLGKTTYENAKGIIWHVETASPAQAQLAAARDWLIQNLSFGEDTNFPNLQSGKR